MEGHSLLQISPVRKPTSTQRTSLTNTTPIVIWVHSWFIVNKWMKGWLLSVTRRVEGSWRAGWRGAMRDCWRLVVRGNGGRWRLVGGGGDSWVEVETRGWGWRLVGGGGDSWVEVETRGRRSLLNLWRCRVPHCSSCRRETGRQERGREGGMSALRRRGSERVRRV